MLDESVSGSSGQAVSRSSQHEYRDMSGWQRAAISLNLTLPLPPGPGKYGPKRGLAHEQGSGTREWLKTNIDFHPRSNACGTCSAAVEFSVLLFAREKG